MSLIPFPWDGFSAAPSTVLCQVTDTAPAPSRGLAGVPSHKCGLGEPVKACVSPPSTPCPRERDLKQQIINARTGPGRRQREENASSCCLSEPGLSPCPEPAVLGPPGLRAAPGCQVK